MKLIAFASFKGGAGKTTALMAVASSLIHRGHKVALFEADENQPLDQWRQNAETIGTWSERCRLYPADDVERFGLSFETAESDQVDIGLIDTQGGGSDLNNTILLNAQLIVVPTALTTLDIDASLETFEYVAELLKGEGVDTPIAMLITRLPVGKLTTSQRDDLTLLETLPQFESRLSARDAFATTKAKGLLHILEQKLAADPAKRLMARHIATATREADLVTKDMLDALALEEPAHAD